MDHQDKASPDSGDERLVAGRYRLLSRLGEGGMGVVWRARDESLHREVAVKEVRAPVGLAEVQVERMYTRLEREAWAAARISSRGVVTVHDVATHDGRPWIIMEFVRGRSLADAIVSQGALPPREAARIGAEVLAALRAAHDAGVLHRDVKPGNVLLSDDGRVVLTDFGIAAVEGDTALTMTGEVVGSPEYLAPERALGQNPGAASDLWSLGALLYATVEGRSPFRRTSALATLRAVVDDELPEPHRAGPLASVIKGLMHKDPVVRMTAEQAGEELRLAAADIAASGSTVPSPTVGLPSPTEEVRPTVQQTAVGQPTAVSPLDETVPPASAEAPTAAAAGTVIRDPRLPVPEPETTSKAEAPTADGARPTAGDTAPGQPRVPGTAQTATAESGSPTPGAPAETSNAPTAQGPAAPGAPSSSTAPHHPAEATAQSPSAFGAPPSMSEPTVAAPAFHSPAAPEQVIGAGEPGSGPARKGRRTGYVIAAAAAAVVVLAGGIGYALMDRGDGEKGDASPTPTGQARDTATEAAGSGPDDKNAEPVSVTVTGSATTYVGDCPPADSQAPVFTATFKVSELPVQFSYRWVSSNGTVIDRQWRTLAFREDSSPTHKETVRLSTYAREGTLSSDMAVEIKSPFDAVSNSVPFSVTCDAAKGH
ncbi:protein kinase domain-containing protein [Streptomyces cadmiisoli]|uniref:serine/threonine-protein kinase n=1 Tax=Streptomyces cadmiisoli TaxID=2184053 RepID=UPI003D71628D